MARDLSVRTPESINQEMTGTQAGAALPADSAFVEEEQTLNVKREEEVRKLKIQNDLLQAKFEKITGDNKARKTHSLLIFVMVFFWLVSVVALLALSGLGILCLSDKVLITLLTTTTINVIGLLVIVANYLFNKNKST
ncbi:MAG TPA: hypothetical protein VL547_15800 [Dinghuibacter sp.]|uniref:hypothetical protein n=1 Tax=Dinghuibacter sp. TaxID=2024697 RepID=UPI002CB86EB7|nr:hypothetical protein [Dinghuibacter sp.]HTJ13499.1 hypothetical protein [Dinghuibacter sp.]